MKDQTTNIAELKKQIQNFCEQRDWDPFHGPKDLAIGAVTEASELLEIFRFQTTEQEQEILKHPDKRQAIGEELADVLFFLLRFSQRYDFDLSSCFLEKMRKNAVKYPVSEFKGKNHKSQKSL